MTEEYKFEMDFELQKLLADIAANNDSEELHRASIYQG